MGYNSSGFMTESKDNGYRKEFFGKYRAVVTNNHDAKSGKGRMGRIKVKCPKVLGDDESDWCLPCLPFAGKGKGSLFMPQVGDTVWVEFEGGDPNLPIWTGNWWALDEVPEPVDAAYSNKESGLHHVLATGKVQLHFDDKNGRLSITVDGTKPVSLVLDTVAGTVTTKGYTETVVAR